MGLCTYVLEVTTTRQNEAGKTECGSQRLRWMHCGYKYTLGPKQQCYSDNMRLQAVQMYVDGMNLPGSHAILAFTTVRFHYGPKPALPACLKRRYPQKSSRPRWMNCSLLSARIELDLHPAIVDRQTRCYFGWKVVWERTQPAI